MSEILQLQSLCSHLAEHLDYCVQIKFSEPDWNYWTNYTMTI